MFSPNRRRSRSFSRRDVRSHGALPWKVEKSFSELTALPPPPKTERLSWITSDKAFLPGQRSRLRFLDALRQQRLPLDLYGKGFNPIQDKFDALGAYRYSLAVENYSGPDYWTEKIAGRDPRRASGRTAPTGTPSSGGHGPAGARIDPWPSPSTGSSRQQTCSTPSTRGDHRSCSANARSSGVSVASANS